MIDLRNRIALLFYQSGVAAVLFEAKGGCAVKIALKGVIHGRTIELEDEAGFPDGQEVSVSVKPVLSATSPTSPEALTALRRAAGAWADDAAELDRYLEWNRHQRKGNRVEILE